MMISIQELNKYIKNILQYPEMYCSSFQSFEDCIFVLNSVRGTLTEFDKFLKEEYNTLSGKTIQNRSISYELKPTELVELHKRVEEKILTIKNYHV